MSLHLSSFLGHFCTLFLSLREKFFDFLHCGADAFGNVLVSDALNPPNFINGHSVNVVHPKPAELCFRQLVPDQYKTAAAFELPPAIPAATGMCLFNVI